MRLSQQGLRRNKRVGQHGATSLQGTPRAACTIVIPTLALRERSAMLDRAIGSIRAGNVSTIDIIVVVNGSRYDAGVVDSLLARRDLSVIRISPPSFSAALHAGRLAVKTAFFGFLDDDDEYLPGAVDARVAALHADPHASLVVSNGYRRAHGADQIAMATLHQVPGDPLTALFHENWLASCGGLFRTDLVAPELFADIGRYLEWTWLAYRMAVEGHRIAVLDMPGFRIHDTAGSESKSEAYLLSHAALYARMLRSAPRRDVERVLRSRLCQAWHDASVHYRGARLLGLAWLAHLRSLGHPAGWKFLPYTRHLLRPRLRLSGR